MRPRDDRGAASVFVLAVGAVLVSVGLLGAAVGAARVARHEARVAADLGALAGAGRAIEGQLVACTEAARYAAANGARMTACVVTGLEVVIRVEVVIAAGTATASARAGPIFSW